MELRQIALFTEMLDFDESYMDLVWRASDHRAIAHHAHLIICVGRRLDHLEPEGLAQNLVYALALRHPFNAFVLSQTVYQHMESQPLQEFAQRMGSLPAACTNIDLGTVPCVKFDNSPPMRQLMHHLIQEHGYTRILLVTGPMDIPETKARMEIWREEMADAGLDHGDPMIIEGHFNPSYVPALAQQVLERIRELHAQAVVCCSDLIAATLCRELKLLGLHIPDDIAITGYDDIFLARFIDPPLTTVRQPVFLQYEAAMDRALGLSHNKLEMNGELVIRGSCGCGMGKWSADSSENDASPEALALEVLRQLNDSCEVPVQLLRTSLNQAHERSRFLRSRVWELNLFARCIDELDSIEGLVPILNEWLPRLGIDTFVISLACDEMGSMQPYAVDSEQALLPIGPLWHRILTSRPGLPANCSAIIEAGDLIPSAWLEGLDRSTFVAMPLALNNTWYGLAIMEISQEGNLMCRSVQELTSSYLDREYRLREMLRKNLEARIRTQMEREKMQSVSTLIAGVAHDLATPLGVSRTTTDYLRENFRNLRQAFEANDLARSSLAEFLDDGDAALSIMASSVDRAIEHVTSFKRISSEVPRDDLRSFKILGFIRDILKNLQPLWRHRPVSVQLEGDENLEVTTHAAPFLDILTNLVQNSLVHAWPESVKGTIIIQITADSERPEHCRLVFSNDGEVIPAENLQHIFEPFFTTREGKGGTGLGLHIIEQRVQLLLGGTIRCESSSEQGTRFIISFPRILSA